MKTKELNSLLSEANSKVMNCTIVYFQVQSWPIGARGLSHDRKWMVVTSAGVLINQKREPRLTLIQPIVDLDNGLLHLTYPGTAITHSAMSSTCVRIREWSLFMAGGAVEFRKSLSLKTCPPSIIARHVFAPPPNLFTEILPPPAASEPPGGW